MESSFKTKHFIFAAVTAILTVLVLAPFEASSAVVALIAQIGFFSALMASSFSAWHLAVPVVSYGIGFLLTGDPITAALSLVYVPVSGVIALCLRKEQSRGVTVVLSSLTVGVLALACGAVWALLSGVELTASGVADFISKTGESVVESLVSGIPDNLFNENLSREVYKASLLEIFKYFSIGIFVLLCNVIAFSSTAITKRVVWSLENEEGKLFGFTKDWLFVLSKPSAAVFVICYLCLFIGGETLTLPQQIAFNTVVVAIQGGVFVMAFRSLREKIRIGGFGAVALYLVMFFFFGMSSASIVLSIVGLVAAFRQKSKEDNESCEN